MGVVKTPGLETIVAKIKRLAFTYHRFFRGLDIFVIFGDSKTIGGPFLYRVVAPNQRGHYNPEQH